ncbi:MAG: ClpXP protease specificity-enhancing factor [Pseudomonadota bacterium]
MKPQRPYLLRALYDWLLDSDETPYVLVDATIEGVVVPGEFVQNGQIVLNIGPNAVRDLNLGDEYVMFASRFNGQSMEVVLPLASVRAVYGKDSGQGMVFPDEGYATSPSGVVGSEPQAGERADAEDTGPSSDQPADMQAADTTRGETADEEGSGSDEPPDKPTLRLV